MSACRIGIVGAGILGLAHAWSAAKRGHHVTVFERSPRASGASIRNFGMVWPIGQPAGEPFELAMHSRALWREVAAAANLWLHPCGSLHLAHRADEWDVLREFAEIAGPAGYQCSLLDPEHVLQRSPAANPRGLLGGLLSATEMCVDSPSAVREIPNWLATTLGVRFEFSTTISTAETGSVVRTDGSREQFDRIVICGGDEFGALFPREFQQSGLRRCKLQMLKTVPQEHGWRIGPHVASGLTLRHYRSFEACSGLAALKHRIATETPELDRFGIHVMASQNDEGSVILGDSHEYDDEIEPFDRALIEDLILRSLRTVIVLPDWNLAARWHGTYAKHPTEPSWETEPTPGVFVRTGLGGAGMTLSFALAERDWERWS